MNDQDITRLYKLPLSGFTAARNELAKRLRSEGDRATADEVKALAKPSVAAWAVNQLFYSERETFDRLLASGAAQRRALAKGAASRTAADRKRKAMTELLRHAERLLVAAGSSWTPSLRQRVHRTLETLAAQAPGERRAGRLTEDLQPAGFDALLGAAIAPASAPPRGGTAKASSKAKRPSAAERRRRDAARERVSTIKSDLAAARRKRSAAARELESLERRAETARNKARSAEGRAEKARQEADALDLEARRARSTLDQAASEVARTEARFESERRKANGPG